MLFLEDLWYGNISPGEERCRPNSEYSKAFRATTLCSAEQWGGWYREIATPACALVRDDRFFQYFKHAAPGECVYGLLVIPGGIPLWSVP